MSLLPVMVIFGLSFPPVFFEIIVALILFFIVCRLLQPTGIYDFVWHPALFNTALYCCIFYLISLLFV
ncbi:p-hydroxybenzoic acid efflux pump operon protein AaeX [Edaphovirga cremea]|uniref:p-hydroxybenzoic acid efflux pump operon protein AaeX n=1 Tax=Edaphovirga cremea TaxID=2267246 RepID=UPI00398A238C